MRYTHGGNVEVHEQRRDRGTSFVEILVSIVLLGTVVGGTLTALRTTIVSSEADGNQAKANAWLLAAAETVYQTTFESCPASDVGDVQNAYDNAVRVGAPPSEWWPGGSVGVNVVYFWSKSDGREVWADVCGTSGSPQLVEIYVRSPDGDVGKTMRVVKDGA